MHFSQYNPTYPPHLLGFFLAFLLYFFPSEGHSQLSEADSIQIWSDMDLANSFYKSRQWDSADYYFGEVIELGKKTEEWDKVVFAYFRRGERWWKNTEIQTAIDTLEKGLALGYQKLGKDYSFHSHFHLALAKAENTRHNHNKALYHCRKAESLIKKHSITKNSSKNQSSINKGPKNLGGCYSIMGQIYQDNLTQDSAIYYFDLSIKEFDKYPGKSVISSLGVKSYLAGAYSNYGHLKRAADLCKHSLAIINEDSTLSEFYQRSFRAGFYLLLGEISFTQKDYEKALFYSNLISGSYHAQFLKANIYNHLGEPEKAIEYFHKCLDYINKKPDVFFKKINETHRIIAEIYIAQGKSQEAKKLLDQSESFILNNSTKDFQNNSEVFNYQIRKLYLTKAKVHLLHHEYDLAEDNLRKVYQSDYDSSFSLQANTSATALILLANRRLDEKQYIEAISFFDQSIQHLSPNQSEEIIGKNIQQKSLSNLNLYFNALTGKATTYYQWYKDQKDLTFLETSIQYYEESLKVIDLVKHQRTLEASKVNFASNGAKIMVNLSQCFLDLYHETGDKNHIYKAFLVADKNKAGVLYETVHSTKTQKFLGVADSILAKEQSLKIDLAYYEKKIFDKSYASKPGIAVADSLISQWVGATANIKSELDKLEQKISQEYPEYAQLNNNSSIISIEEIQDKMIDQGEVLLEYVIGESKIFVFLIKKDDFSIIPIDRPDSLTHQIDMLRQGIYGYWGSSDRTVQSKKKHDKLYTTNAYQLYKSLIEPLFPDKEIPSSLIIIPDGILNYIPFEALLSEEPETTGQFNQYSYLINKTQISYGFSASLIKEMKNKKIKTKNNLLAIAPTFKESDNLEALSSSRRDNFSPLLYTEDEVNYLGDMFGGEIWTSDKAAKQSFIEQAQEYRIIHLATHAKMLDDQPKFSRIAFTQLNDTIDQPDFLTIAEIYNLKLNAEMVVLSACETGIGKLQKGEGVMSMSRAFAFSGTKSIITSLWSVDDQATSKIMKSFYSYLDQGETKDAALQKAKLDYINNHDRQASHPFFWAGFVGFGDMSPTSLQPNYNWAWILTIIGLVLGILAYIAYRRKS